MKQQSINAPHHLAGTAKWRSLRKLANVLIVGSAFVLPGVVQADTVRFTDQDPENCPRCVFLTENYIPAVEEATGGEITIQPLFGGVIGTHRETVQLVENGVVQFGVTWVGAHPGVFVAQSMFDLFPTGPSDYEDQIYFYRQVYDRIPAIQAELEERNLKLMMIAPLLHLGFASKDPITNIDDIEGNTWRAGSRWLLRYLESAGASPVSVPWGDVYVSLQTGVIDGVLTNYDGIDNMNFYEPAPHILIASDLWMANPMIYVVNKDYFEGLPQEVQDSWIEASLEAEAAYGAILANVRAGIIESQRAAGVTVTEMSDADLQAWENPEALAGARALWVEEATEAGLEDAQAVMDMAIEIHQEALARLDN